MKCETCKFSVGYEPPGAEPVRVGKKKSWFSDDHWDNVHFYMLHTDWQNQKYYHESMVQCNFMPTPVKKSKENWCGQYQETP